MNNEITRERLEQVVKEAAEQISSKLLLDDGRILLSVTCANETVSEFITEDAIHHLGKIARRLADELSDEKK